MSSEVQREIDLLGSRLSRSVVLNDPDIHLVYASRHYGDEDEVRIRAALYRDAGSRPISYLLSCGIAHWSTIGRVPAAPELGLRSRVCVPVRFHGELLGFVLVIDDEATLTQLELELIEAFAGRIAGLLVAERRLSDQEHLATQRRISQWLGDDPLERADGLAALLGSEVVSDQLTQVRVVVFDTSRGAANFDAGHIELAIGHATEAVRPTLRGRLLFAVLDGHAAMVLLSASPLEDAAVMATSQQALAEISAFTRNRLVVHVGVGAPAPALADAWLSRRQAELAARAVPLMGAGDVVHWKDLGAYSLLVRIPTAELDQTAMPESVRALEQADPDGRLIESLQAYLRHGGSGSAAAKELHVHRTSLYYRLDKIREITGLDLDRGDARLELELGLAVRQLRRSISS